MGEKKKKKERERGETLPRGRPPSFPSEFHLVCCVADWQWFHPKQRLEFEKQMYFIFWRRVTSGTGMPELGIRRAAGLRADTLKSNP